MSRLNAILLVVICLFASPAFSADPPVDTTTPTPAMIDEPDIDPATGLSRDTIVRPLRENAEMPQAATARVPPRARGRPHIALILPTASPSLGPLAEALRQGFAAAAQVAGSQAPPVNVTAVESEGSVLVDACRHSDETGAVVIVGGMTRDGAHMLATGNCTAAPVLVLNEVVLADPEARLPSNVFSISLSLDQEARQVALMAVADGMRSAIVVASSSPLSRRVQEAFESEWTRAAGEVRRVAYSGNPDDAPALREQVRGSRADMVFLALDPAEARTVRPYVSAMLPVYTTSFSVNPRAEAVVNVDLQGVRYGEMPWFVAPESPTVAAYPQPKSSMSVDQERLYALGIDAFRLAQLLLRPQGSRVELDGVTGRIVLEGPNVFTRILAPAEVDGGRVIPLRTAQ
ncbi:MAG TPA: penicillin-binding protein activator [Usitatibacter sp.]|jgi:uncharacterized protein|nr:penicillin-binding protein activator [Usitatibacter sp.]